MNPDPDRNQQQAEVDDRDREAAAHVVVEQVDRAGQRNGQERRAQHPADRLAQQVDQVERDREYDRDEQRADDDPRRVGRDDLDDRRFTAVRAWIERDAHRGWVPAAADKSF